eukprot:scaffold12693_cov142-Isochrysis_galbana.AAC.7
MHAPIVGLCCMLAPSVVARLGKIVVEGDGRVAFEARSAVMMHVQHGAPAPSLAARAGLTCCAARCSTLCRASPSKLETAAPVLRWSLELCREPILAWRIMYARCAGGRWLGTGLWLRMWRRLRAPRPRLHPMTSTPGFETAGGSRQRHTYR